MGFDYTSINTFEGTLTSKNVIDISPESTLYIRSNLTATGSHDILGSISASRVPSFGMINYQCPDVEGLSQELSTTNSNIFHFSLTNENSVKNGGQVLNTNGRNINFCLLFFKKDDISTILKEWMTITLENEE